MSYEVGIFPPPCLTRKGCVTIHGPHYTLRLVFIFLLLSVFIEISLLPSKNILGFFCLGTFFPGILFMKRCGYKKKMPLSYIKHIKKTKIYIHMCK